MIDQDIVRTAYRLFLGREPENDVVVAEHAASHHSLDTLRGAFLRSPEFLKKSGASTATTGEFRSDGATNAPRIAVLSNCQGPEIARVLAMIADVSVLGMEVMNHDPNNLGKWRDKLRDIDVLISIRLSSNFAGIRVDELPALTKAKIYTVGAVYFDGLHPDIVAVGPMNNRLEGPMISHSGIILYSYLKRFSVAECEKLFSGKTYEEFGYFDRWKASEEEFRKREGNVDIKIAEEFFGMMKDEPTMLTLNHPTVNVLSLICKNICKHLGLPFKEIPDVAKSTHLTQLPVWPVYDEIAEYHGLKYRTTNMFCRRHDSFNLRSFIERSYQMYQTYDRAALLEGVRRKPPVWASRLDG